MTDLLVGTRKGLFPISKKGKKFTVGTPDFLGVPVTAVLADRRDGTTYAALNHGHYGQKVHRRDAGASAFVEVASVDYPPKPDTAGADEPWATEMIWCLEEAGDDRPGSIWAGTIPGGLFRSDDRGGSWVLNDALWGQPSRPQWFGGGYDHAGIHSVSVDPRDSDRVVVAISCAGAWGTTDGGKSWEVSTGMRNAYMPPERAYDGETQDPHRLVACPADPDVMWVQHHNGVFRSTDGGRTFTEITERPPSTFGFGVAAHPTDRQTAWFAPAVKDELRIPVDGQVVVSRTRDGGQSFEVLSKGLPGPDAYDLVYRHCLEVDSTGERLAMASTTGSLWVSTDAGDTWSTVSTSLPPVACLRWT